MNGENINNILWEKVEPYYIKQQYDETLRIACLFVIDIIKEKSDSDKDGEKLIQEVFLGKSPKIIINNYVNESEKDEQRGFGLILQGLICSVRNPISHELEYNFTKEMTDSIIIFISDYILAKINSSKEFSYVEDWTDFILDRDFIEDEDYIKLILENMSQAQCYTTLTEILSNLNRLNENNRRITINLMVLHLNKKYRNQLVEFLNKKMITYGDNRDIRMFLSNFPSMIWIDLNKIVSVRLEKMILNSITEGEVVIDEEKNYEVKKGSLGTWLSNDFLQVFSNKEEILTELDKKLNYSREEGKYVVEYFKSIVQNNELFDEKTVKNGLTGGNINFYELFMGDIQYEEEIEKFAEDVYYFIFS